MIAVTISPISATRTLIYFSDHTSLTLLCDCPLTTGQNKRIFFIQNLTNIAAYTHRTLIWACRSNKVVGAI